MTLEFARSSRPLVGANPRDADGSRGWVYLLPSLEIPQTFVVGSLPDATLELLRGLSDRVAVADAPPEPGGLTPGSLLCVGPDAAAPPAAQLQELLRAGASAYLARSPRSQPAAELSVATAALASGAPGPPALTGPTALSLPPPPRAGSPLRSALRRRAAGLLRRTRAAGTSRVSESQAALRPIPAPLPPDRDLLLLPDGTGLPAYLREVAGPEGADPACGWALAPFRGYRSQKVLFFVDASTPVVIKLTQEPRFNRSLEQEAKMLAGLERLSLPSSAPQTPQIIGRGTHAGLTLLGQSRLPARPFPALAPVREWSPQADAVARALTALGSQTARPAADMAAALGVVAAQYRATYGEVDPGLPASVDAAAERLAATERQPPAVLMHGDATVYNVMLGEGDRCGLVDWENGELTGMPLWDLLHFAHSHDAWAAESMGRRSRWRELAEALRRPAGLRELPAGPALAAYCETLGIAEALIPDLATLWLARHAVREARQLTPETLASSGYLRMLRQLSEQR